jgi:hypothetical protein
VARLSKEAYLSVRGRTGSTVVSLVLLIAVGVGTAAAKIVVPSGSVIEVDKSTVNTVVEAFEQAEQAIKAHNLEKDMGIYSSQYNYHGLKKDDIRKIWKDLFDEYREIATTHLVTKMTKVGAGRDAVLEVTCTGHLWARSKTTGLYVPIDSWHEEVHYLVLEDEAWRLRGNLGESPRVLPFGTAPHPLF